MEKSRKDSKSPQNNGSGDDQGAYLILRNAGRWSDIFRLTPPGEAVIGRASSNQVVIRSDRASRQHAKISWSGQRWQIEDLESRNGTFLNGQKLEKSHSLSNSDQIEVAGFAITFANRIEGGIGEPVVSTGSSAQATDDQITMDVDATNITDRRRRSAYLHGRPETASTTAPSRQLLQLAFDLARCDELDQAVDRTLRSLSQQTPLDTAGVYVWQKSSAAKSLADIPLLATRQTGHRSYRRPPEPLVHSLTSEEGEAILARNVIGDGQLATENSRGEIDVESVIVAPIRDHRRQLLGMIHLTSCIGGQPLSGNDLEYTVAACEILAEALGRLSDQRRLSRSLKQSQRQIKALQQRLGDKVQIVGSSKPIADVVQQVGLAAPTNATVLIRGESGVGKELVAAAIHHSSGRRNGPLVCLNCAALSPTLLESELFGHEKGAFTGATERKQGKFEAADGGTLMLDEIGEMGAEIQAKFLRVLEGHPFERVGGQTAIKVDVRVVAATNRDLQAMVRDGSFRQDLYYRLHVVEILVPPLRQRDKDCLLLADFFLHQFNREMGRKISGFTETAKKMLVNYSWPGNIRELKNVIERAVVLNMKGEIDASDLVLSPAVEQGPIDPLSPTGTEQSLAEIEKQHIERVLRHTEGNKSRAASILGIERSTLDRKLKKYTEK
ncbi:MAG: sigma 54-interacting transcriptional regulator [Rubripirellula sp.]|nr:sigma 54-interacting transcriptional regulator [Rubripirellula sp.]